MSKAKKGTTPTYKTPQKQSIAGDTPPPSTVFQPALDLPSVSQDPPVNDGLFRKIFWGLSLSLIIGMPLLSTQYGITADEWGNKAYGELCLDYFTSLGEKKEALSYAPRGGEVMYCYGPTLDLISAAIYRTTGADPYTAHYAFADGSAHHRFQRFDG
jgi:hypothetical protein